MFAPHWEQKEREALGEEGYTVSDEEEGEEGGEGEEEEGELKFIFVPLGRSA